MADSDRAGRDESDREESNESLPTPWDDLVDRDRRGGLTVSDRRYLFGHPESAIEPYSAAERRARQRIRERTVDAILDFSVLLEFMQERDLNQIFSRSDRSEYEQRLFEDAVADLIAFLYVGLLNEGEPGPEYWFSEGVGRGEDHLIDSPSTVAIADVDISVTRETVPEFDIDEAIEKFETGDLSDLTEHQLREFLKIVREAEMTSENELREAYARLYPSNEAQKRQQELEAESDPDSDPDSAG